MAPMCGTCGSTFAEGFTAREQHMNATGHAPPRFECACCDKFFASDRARIQHQVAVSHMPYRCHINQCWKAFDDKDLLEDHHVLDHNYCGDCQRYFMNLNNIQQHRNSKLHRGRTMCCPFCKRGFTTATGLSHHLEAGACPQAPHLNRDSIYQLVRSRDPDGFISKALLDWHGSFTYEVTSQAFNGELWECYLCHREFKYPRGLNQHINSTHQQELYHCPHGGCRMEFRNLAAIINHLESESCGFTRFENVQRAIQGLVNSNRLIDYQTF